MTDTTTNYSFYLPEINGDEAAWGQMLNANTTALDEILATIAGLGVGVEEAPTDGQNYVRDGLNNQWNVGLSEAEMALTFVPILPAEGDGIDFSETAGTVAAGATTTSQVLSYFEYGKWTANLWDGTFSSGEGQTYSAQECDFQKIGTCVFFSGEMTLTSKGTLTGLQPARIGPLPYPPGAALSGGGSVVEFLNVTVPRDYTALMLEIGSGGNGNLLIKAVDSDLAIADMNSVGIIELADDTSLKFYGFYFTD